MPNLEEMDPDTAATLAQAQNDLQPGAQATYAFSSAPLAILGGMLADGTLNLIFGAAGVGKTTVVAYLIMALLAGGCIFGRPCAPLVARDDNGVALVSRILVYEGENRASEAQQLVAAVASAFGTSAALIDIDHQVR